MMPIGRRRFLQAGGAALAVVACGRRAPARPALLEHPGVQLYTVREAAARDMAGALERVAALGYREVEFAGWFDHGAEAVHRMLGAAGLSAPAAHVSLEALTEDAEPLFERAAVIGHRWLVVPWIDAEQRRSLDDWRRIADALSRAGERARERGLRVAYHNHDFELAGLDGAVPLELLLGGTDPSLVDFEIDFYWVARGGGDPLALFAAHPGRFRLAHLKDTAGGPEYRMVDVGAGVLDWPSLIAAGRAAGIEHWFVEHDQPDDAFRSIRNSHAYLTGAG